MWRLGMKEYERVSFILLAKISDLSEKKIANQAWNFITANGIIKYLVLMAIDANWRPMQREMKQLCKESCEIKLPIKVNI